MNEDNNPLIQPEDFFAGYNKSIENLKNDPTMIAFDKLVYEVWEHQESGRKLMELCIERYLIPSLVGKGQATYQLDVLWQEGFRDAWIMVMTSVMSHQQRIKAETK